MLWRVPCGCAGNYIFHHIGNGRIGRKLGILLFCTYNSERCFVGVHGSHERTCICSHKGILLSPWIFCIVQIFPWSTFYKCWAPREKIHHQCGHRENIQASLHASMYFYENFSEPTFLLIFLLKLPKVLHLDNNRGNQRLYQIFSIFHWKWEVINRGWRYCGNLEILLMKLGDKWVKELLLSIFFGEWDWDMSLFCSWTVYWLEFMI